MPRFSDYVAGLAVDVIGGVEKLPVIDVATPRHVTPALLAAYTIDQLVAAAPVTPVTGDALLLERSGTEQTVDINALSSYVIARVWTDASEVTPATSDDKLLMNRSGSTYELDIDVLATYVNSANLDLTSLATGTPGTTDLILYGSGSNPRAITLANLQSEFWTAFATYVDGLTENVTMTANDKFWVLQGGTPKWVDPDVMQAFFSTNDGDVTGPVSTTENNVPQWDSTSKQLKDGLTVVTTVRTVAGGAVDTALATEQAVAERFESFSATYDGDISDLDIDGGTLIGADLSDGDLIIVDDGAGGANRACPMSRVRTYIATANSLPITALSINGATDIGADLQDGDLIPVDDGASGTNRKSAVSRIWDYIVSKIQGTPNKAVPVDTDIMMIQDSANSNNLTELTLLGLKNYVSGESGVLNNYSSTSNPTVSDDSSRGYGLGSVWINLVTGAAFICVDDDLGAAVWTSTTEAAAGWNGNINSTDFSTGNDVASVLQDADQVVIGDSSDSDNPKRAQLSRFKTYANNIQTLTFASSDTLTASQCNGQVVYVTSAATLTLPPVAEGMSVAIFTIGNVAVSIDPNASDRIWLDGAALDDGDKIDNSSTAGDIAVLTYYSADGWHATTYSSTGGWTDGGA